MNNLVSVIVPVYNVEKYLTKCVESIISQTYTNIEIILVDDGAKDRSGELCDYWKDKDNRITVVHKKNEGLGLARNTGLEFANGKYVMYVDSDDYIAIDMVERLVEAATRTAADTVFCGLTRVMPDGRLVAVPAYYDNVTFDGDKIISEVLCEMIGSRPSDNEDANLYMSVWHALYSRKIIEDNKIRFTSERKIMCEDIIYHIDYLKHSKRVTYIADSLYNYRVNEKSLSQIYDSTRYERQKHLSCEIQKRMNEFVEKEKYINREYRRFLGGARSQVLAIVGSKEPHKVAQIRTICSDEFLMKVLGEYPYTENPLKHRVFNYCLKRKKVLIMLWIAYIMVLKKKMI